MKNRREFLRRSGALVLGSFLIPKLTDATLISRLSKSSSGIGIQLYTANRFMGTDVKAFLEQIAAIGFTEIESAFSPLGNYYGMKPKELATLINDLGMKWRSHHVLGAPFGRPRPTPANQQPQDQAPQNPPNQDQQRNQGPRNFPPMLTLRENMQQLVDEAAEGGLEYLVCASTPIGTIDDINASIETFQKTGEACKKAGIQFAYHNHATEFDSVEGQRPYDLILGQTDKDLVKMELDLAWAVKAGQDPAKLFEGNPGRFPLWHIKDFDLQKDTIVRVGEGDVDFKSIFEQSETAGLQYFFYEQDTAQSMEDVQVSFNNLKKILS